MPRIHLTDISVKALKPCDVATTFYDVALPNFGIRVSKTTKTSLVMRGRKRKRIPIGRYPQISLKDARDEARRLLLQRDEPQDTTTFAEAFDKYLETYVRPNYRPRSAGEVERLIRKHASSLFPKPLADITTRDCTTIFDGLLHTPVRQTIFVGRRAPVYRTVPAVRPLQAGHHAIT